MSLEATKAVWERSKVYGTEKFVLLAIADYADRDGRAYPSQSQLAEKTRLSRRTIQRTLDALESSGELVVEQIGNGRTRTHYRIAIIRGASNPTIPDVADDASGASTNTTSMSQMTPQGRQVVQRNKEEQSVDSHRTVSERGMQNPAPVCTDFSDHDAAAQQGMILFNVRGNPWRRLFLECIPTAIRAGVEVLSSTEHMHAEFTRYRARGGLKSDWFFLTDLYGKPEKEWGLDGIRHKPDSRTATLRAFGLD